MNDHFWLTIGSIHDWINDHCSSDSSGPQATLLLDLLIGENDFSDRWQEKVSNHRNIAHCCGERIQRRDRR